MSKFLKEAAYRYIPVSSYLEPIGNQTHKSLAKAPSLIRRLSRWPNRGAVQLRRIILKVRGLLKYDLELRASKLKY